MSDDGVTIDPEFRPSRRGRGNGDGGGPKWIGVAVMVVAAFVFGWLLRSSQVDAPEPTSSNTLARLETTDSAVTSAPPTGRLAPVVARSPVGPGGPQVALRDAVPGFADTITTLIWGRDGVDIMRWEALRPGPETVVSLDHGDGGWNRSVDASGRWLVEIRGDSALTVHAVTGDGVGSGAPLRLEDAGGARAWSAGWHDSRPGRLAWLACDPLAPGSVTSFYTIDVSVPAAGPAALPLPGFSCDHDLWLARWGDWGALLHTTDGSGTDQLLLDAAGTEVARGRLGPEGEWFVGVGPGGTTLWTEGLGIEGASSFLMSADGRERRPVPGLNAGERLESALGSPDGSLLALVPDLVANFGSAVRIVEADTGSVLAEIPEPSWWVTRMVWSTDSRFLIYERWPDITSNWAGVPQHVQLVFFDTQANTGVALPLPGYAPALRSRA